MSLRVISTGRSFSYYRRIFFPDDSATDVLRALSQYRTRVDPLQKFSWGSGSRGAWELAVRVSALDLDSGPFPGGKQHDASVALNWYPRRKMRLMFNYITGNVDSRAEGRFNILQARFLYYL